MEQSQPLPPASSEKLENPEIQPPSSLNLPTPGHSDKFMRKFPYPYKAMLAVSSDIDGTTPEEFKAYHRFLNTKENTVFGRGVGLDIADSFWLFMGNNQHQKVDKDGHGLDHVMTFFKGVNPSQKHDADLIKSYFKVGWIDSLHTYGDFSRADINDVTFSRKDAEAAWKALKSSGIKPVVWINHGNAANKQNFGTYNLKHPMDYQEGDKPGSPYYHTDLTLKNGIRFAWNSMSQSEFGFDYPLFPLELRDGQKIWGFYRYTNDYKDNKVYWTWGPRLLHKQITRNRLDRLVQKGQYSIIAQHLGGLNYYPFGPEDIQAVRRLAEYNDLNNKGAILVTRTSRLLTYAEVHQFVDYQIVKEKGIEIINIDAINDPVLGIRPAILKELRGLTFYTDNPDKTFINLNKKPIEESYIQRNPQDQTGRKSIGIKWFSPDYTDYTKKLN